MLDVKPALFCTGTQYLSHIQIYIQDVIFSYSHYIIHTSYYIRVAYKSIEL